MTKKGTFISISLPETLKEKVEARLAGSDFGNVSEYLRSLIRADLARFDYEKLIKERLALADQGGPFIKHEDVEAYLDAKVRGENPSFPATFHL